MVPVKAKAPPTCRSCMEERRICIWPDGVDTPWAESTSEMPARKRAKVSADATPGQTKVSWRAIRSISWCADHQRRRTLLLRLRAPRT